jgi:hypothetical protein
MVRILSLVAVLTAALFAGAALYINLAEQPARLTLDTSFAVAQWAPSYRRATWMQAPLALMSLICGVGVWLMSGFVGWLIAAVLIGLVIPFTFIGIMPTNKSLLLRGRDLGSPETRALLERWGKLHAVRTALSLAATVQYLWLLSGG